MVKFLFNFSFSGKERLLVEDASKDLIKHQERYTMCLDFFYSDLDLLGKKFDFC